MYDLTDFLPIHPGGAILASQGGKDATDFFDELHRPEVLQEVAEEAAELGVAERLSQAQPVWEEASLDDDDARAGHATRLHELRIRAAEAEEACHDFGRAQADLATRAQHFRDTLKGIEEKVPAMDQAKKAAAAARNYKEAGALAKETKALLAQKDAVAADLDELRAPLEAADAELMLPKLTAGTCW